MTELASAEAVFGSTGRGDGDALSDRDILIVDTDIGLLRRRQAVLEDSGWSVASYTFEKLNALALNGALFIQHLKGESDIVRDATGQLRHILSIFRPKTSYHCELAQNARLADLIATWPDTARGALWAADVLYVATRNFGILQLAQKQRYLFSYPNVLEALAESGIISSSALPDLLMLRLAKSLYRSGRVLTVEAAGSIVQRAIEALPKPSFPMHSVALNPVEVLSQATALSGVDPAYHRLRNLERIYLSFLALKPTSAATRSLAALARWIEDPRAYASFAAGLEDDLIARMLHMGGIGRRVEALA